MRFSQYGNRYSGTTVVPSGSSTSVSELQLPKALPISSVAAEEIFSDVIDVQCENALLPTLSTDAGILTLSSDEHSLKELSPIV